MALNRLVYGLATPVAASAPREKKPMPFATSRPHAIWTVDLRSLKRHQAAEYASKPLYVITIFDNASRAIVASAPSPSQDLTAFLLVLFSAIHVCGAPDLLVSDGGSVFKAKAALEIYELCAAHARFVGAYNWQEHRAHREREEGRRAPREVLGWMHGRQVDLHG